MKALPVTCLLTLTVLFQAPLHARVLNEEDKETIIFDRDFKTYQMKVENDQFAKNYEQHLEIGSLKRELASVADRYQQKTQYLETELQKTKEKLIETAVYNNKREEFYANKFKVDTETLKNELILKNKLIAEYQRELEKLKADPTYKDLAKQNLELASQMRNLDQKPFDLETKDGFNQESNRRMPASVKP